jgi:hypothetical protein
VEGMGIGELDGPRIAHQRRRRDTSNDEGVVIDIEEPASEALTWLGGLCFVSTR